MATATQTKRKSTAIRKTGPRSKTAAEAIEVHLGTGTTGMLAILATKSHKGIAYITEHLIDDEIDELEDDGYEGYTLTEEEYLNPVMIKEIEEAMAQIRRDNTQPCSLEEFEAQVTREARRTPSRH